MAVHRSLEGGVGEEGEEGKTFGRWRERGGERGGEQGGEGL